jgi:DNA-binding NtrC family response regulator
MSRSLRILIIDDDRRMAKTLVDILRVKGFEAEAANSAEEAITMLLGERFDTVLTDIKMPQMNGVELYKTMKIMQPDLPVVLMTAYSSDSLVKAGLEEGAIAVLSKPLEIDLLLSFFSALRRERSAIIVDNDPELGRTLAQILRLRGMTVTVLPCYNDSLEALGPGGQVFLLDIALSRPDGIDMVKHVKELLPHLPTIVVADPGYAPSPEIQEALRLGACSYLFRPVNVERLLQVFNDLRRTELARLLKQPVRALG